MADMDLGDAMVKASGIRVPASEAEPRRRALKASGLLRDDLKVLRDGDHVVFPVADDGDGVFDFDARQRRARSYLDLLPDDLRDVAPRAFDVLGDIVVVKVPKDLTERAKDIGEALRAFHDARAAFHDRGVKGVFRTRDLERIAGEGDSTTQVAENGVRLTVDPGRAYYSPRLGDERARMSSMAAPDQRWIDLFGGVAPLGTQLAKRGAEVVSIDLNPEACDMARQNAEENHADMTIINGDAREDTSDLAAADHVVMNLPHGAKDFIDVGVRLTRAGGVLHHHEILPKDELAQRQAALVDEIASHGRPGATIQTVRHVRDYSTTDAHYAFDAVIP